MISIVCIATALSGNDATLTVPDVAPLGSQFDVQMDADAPAEIALLMFSLNTANYDAGVYGTILVEIPPFAAFLLPLDSNGDATFSALVPCEPDLVDLTIYMQFLHAGPIGTNLGRGSSNLGTTTIVDGECPDPPEVQLGERLFLETRFAQFFAVNYSGDVNVPLATGDPTLDTITRIDGTSFEGPFIGQSMNCRQCHFVDELDFEDGGGIRTYTDFARRSPIPDRGDGRTTAPRNSPPLVNASIVRDGGTFFHTDAEFAAIEDLVRATITGRNYGWKADESSSAIVHLADVLRGDDGTDALAADFGGLSYADVLAGTPNVPLELLLPASLRIDVTTASDAELFDAVATLIGIYVTQLEFARDDAGAFTGSPFDLFLVKNGLPTQPDSDELDVEYTSRLARMLANLTNPVFVDPSEGSFVHHDQPFVFGATEFTGARMFFKTPSSVPPPPTEIAQGGIGNCIACHFAPGFSDLRFHNVGIAQAEYGTIHGDLTFNELKIPDVAGRNADPDQFLPPSPTHPDAEGVFLRVPSASDPRFTDLGVWNVFANPNVPAPQDALREEIAFVSGLDPVNATDDEILAASIGMFKTAGLRDLADSEPYMHTGQFDSLDRVLKHYVSFSSLARAGNVRNDDPQLAGVALVDADRAALEAFLRSLTHDYD